MTAVLERRETLTDVDDATRADLEQAATAYEKAPENLKAAILAAAESGEKPAAIARAIRYVYTYDYVARLIREDRAQREKASGGHS
jgi:hypothetical protein